MSDPQSGPLAPARWKRPVYLVVVLAALVMVVLAWFHTPEAQVSSDSTGEEYTTIRCANAGPSRWDPPTVSEGQELDASESMQSFNLQVLKNDIESLRASMACDVARDGHTDNLIVTTFAAGTILFFGYNALWRRRVSS